MTTAPTGAYIEVDLDLLPPEQGGRKSPIASGYRCNCWIGKFEDGERSYNDATFFLLEMDRLEPGSRARARVQPHLPDEWSEVVEGSRFELCEGPRVIGIATVLQVSPRV
jgi:hypothetical protein